MKIGEIEFLADWVKDCGGKEDFDFSVLKVSSRFYSDNTSFSQIILGEEVIIETEEEICGETESECKYKTEKWIKENLNKLVSIIKAIYKKRKKEDNFIILKEKEDNFIESQEFTKLKENIKIQEEKLFSLPPIEDKIIEIIKKHTFIDIIITTETKIKDLGIDSLMSYEIVFDIEQEFNIFFPDIVLQSFKTVYDIIDWVKEKGEKK